MMSNVSQVIQQHCLQANESERKTQASFHLWPFGEGASESCIIVRGTHLSGNGMCYREHMQIWLLRNKWYDSRDIAWGIMRISFICTGLTVAIFSSRMRIVRHDSEWIVVMFINLENQVKVKRLIWWLLAWIVSVAPSFLHSSLKSYLKVCFGEFLRSISSTSFSWQDRRDGLGCDIIQNRTCESHMSTTA